jgi:phosphoribosylaminoimidazole-succinocarboxamide synthase
VDARTAPATQHALGALVAEGKTKTIREIAGRPGLVALISKDDITAGDGAKHDVIAGKGALANRTTCNVFRLLKACGLPVAFEEQKSATRISPRGSCFRGCWSSSTSRPRTRAGRASRSSPTTR